VYLIRHGETAWSLSGQHTGVTDIPLTEHGEDEARALSPLLRDIHFAAVLTSPRDRARRTCELAGLESHADIDQNLAEWDYGDYEGQRSVDLAVKCLGKLRTVLIGSSRILAPLMETSRYFHTVSSAVS
jgi:probable phosphoglycerate mutase